MFINLYHSITLLRVCFINQSVRCVIDGVFIYHTSITKSNRLFVIDRYFIISKVVLFSAEHPDVWGLNIRVYGTLHPDVEGRKMWVYANICAFVY